MDQNVAEGVGITEFDFHARSKAGGIESVKSQLSREIGDVEEDFGACVVGVDQDGKVTPILSQKGVFRTNCKDVRDLPIRVWRSAALTPVPRSASTARTPLKTRSPASQSKASCAVTSRAGSAATRRSCGRHTEFCGRTCVDFSHQSATF